MKDVKSKVEYVLEKYPKTRDCDVLLTAYVWSVYCPDKVFENEEGNKCIRLKDMVDLPREDHIRREVSANQRRSGKAETNEYNKMESLT